jgi:hypothetical protein
MILQPVIDYIGMMVHSVKTGKVGEISYAYKEDGRTWLVIEDDHEIPESDLIAEDATSNTVFVR